MARFDFTLDTLNSPEEINNQISRDGPKSTTFMTSGQPNSLGQFTVYGLSEVLLRNSALSSESKVIELLGSVVTGGIVSIWDLLKGIPGIGGILPDQLTEAAEKINPDGGYAADGQTGGFGGIPGGGSAQAQAVIQIAREEIGTKENPPGSDIVKYSQWYPMPGKPWCAMFASWCLAQAGFEPGPITKQALTPLWVKEFRNAGRWTDVGQGDPAPGDLIFFNFDPANDAERLREHGNPVDHVGIVSHVEPDGTIVTIEGNCLRVTAPVLTPEGWVEIGNLQVGDIVCDPDGGTAKVTGVYNKGRQQLYRVHFGDGSYVDATADHLWTIEVPSGGHYVQKTITTQELEDFPRKRMLQIVPPEFPKKDLPLDPYLVGLLIGDGALSNKDSIRFTTQDEELLEAFRERGFAVNHVSRVGTKSHNPIDYTIRGISSLVRDLGLKGKRSWEKYIPEDYLWSSVEDRLNLLRGLMDADGSIDSVGRMEFCTTSKQLADDVQYLVRSLGGKVNVYKKANIFYTSPNQREPKVTRDAYILRNLRLPDGMNPFKLGRKAARVRQMKMWKHWGIRQVEKIDVDDVACISVDSQSNLYITKDFIPTHNTTAGRPENNGGAVLEKRYSSRHLIYGWGTPPYSSATVHPGPDGIFGTEDDVRLDAIGGNAPSPPASGGVGNISAGYQRWLSSAIQAAGVNTRTVNGWESKGAGNVDIYRPFVIVVHCTATKQYSSDFPTLNTVINGRSDLPGPLYNVLIGRFSGDAYIIAAGPTRNAGQGGWNGASHNAHTIGVAWEHDNLDEEISTTAYRNMVKTVAAISLRAGIAIENICGHKEWAPGRKTDPVFLNMDQFREHVLMRRSDLARQYGINIGSGSGTTDPERGTGVFA